MEEKNGPGLGGKRHGETKRGCPSLGDCLKEDTQHAQLRNSSKIGQKVLGEAMSPDYAQEEEGDRTTFHTGQK